MTDGPLEEYETVRYQKPPRWCHRCQAGCAHDRCWLCDNPTEPTGGYMARLMSGAMTWRPELADNTAGTIDAFNLRPRAAA